MVLFGSLDAFEKASGDMFSSSPLSTRLSIKYRHSKGGKFVVKATNNKSTFTFRAQDNGAVKAAVGLSTKVHCN